MEMKQRRSAMNVLVVEDSRTQAEFIRQILDTAGYNVILAGNGAEAIKQVETARPDIVLTDILMPGIDGYELCRRIKQQNPDLPVIMVTVLFDPADVLKGLAAGADSFIVKPPNPEHVCSQIEAVMRGREMAGATEDAEELEIPFNGSTYTIKAGKLQIVNTLLSTYTIAVAKNADLHKVQSQLRSLNSQLRRALDEISLSNENLAEENLTRRRAEKALAEASRKLQLMASITRHDLLNQLSVLWGHLDLALALRDTDQANAWRRVENAVEMVKRINNTLQFTAEYQRIGTSSPAWQEIRSLVEAA
ncbi:MAG TPA: response regulator, partial [Methanoculleus sp.]|nr:response regulator [Methanoculleus sp.]